MEIIRLNLRETPTQNATETTEMAGATEREAAGDRVDKMTDAEVDQGFRQESFWARRISTRFKEKIVVGAMLGTALLSPAAVEAQGKGFPLKKDTQISETTEGKWPEGHLNFYSRGVDGRVHFNPWGILFPAQLEIFRSETTGLYPISCKLFS